MTSLFSTYSSRFLIYSPCSASLLLSYTSDLYPSNCKCQVFSSVSENVLVSSLMTSCSVVYKVKIFDIAISPIERFSRGLCLFLMISWRLVRNYMSSIPSFIVVSAERLSITIKIASKETSALSFFAQCLKILTIDLIHLSEMNLQLKCGLFDTFASSIEIYSEIKGSSWLSRLSMPMIRLSSGVLLPSPPLSLYSFSR